MGLDFLTSPPQVPRHRGDTSAAIAEQLRRLRNLEDHLAALTDLTCGDQAGEDVDHADGPAQPPDLDAKAGPLARRWYRRRAIN